MIRKLAAFMDSVDDKVMWASNYIPALKNLRLLNTFGIDLSYGVGIQMIGEFGKVLKKEGVEVQKGSSVSTLILNDSGEVVGVELDGGKKLGANKGVVFCTGGFSQDREMLKEHIKHPIYMTGAAKGATGDFHKMAKELGADFRCMDKVWGTQTWFEQSFDQWEDDFCIFNVRGDSMVMVNKEGRRVMNEKAKYDTRVKVHWQPKMMLHEGEDADGPYPNQLLFLIGDERCINLHGADASKTWPSNPNSKYFIKANGIKALSAAIAERLETLEDKTGGIKLSGSFPEDLSDTVERFNGYAETGVDKEFHRGRESASCEWTVSPTNDKPNICMYPIDYEGPLYCLIIAPSLIDTKGGATTNTDGAVIRPDGTAIKGLYAAGNSSAPISGDAYWSGGATIGTALTGGWVAGESAATSPGRLST
jgi:succinate dehydrogenase/fumarate reductase flavoprotein subunit